MFVFPVRRKCLRQRAALRRAHLRVQPLDDRCLPSAATPLTDFGPGNSVREVTVMTRNLYVGADLDPAAAAVASGDPFAIIGAVSATWAGIVATNFPERADALAGEIAANEPLLVGLQEVSLLRTGAPDSFFGNPTRADHVEFDYVDILMQKLSARGLHYAAVAVTQGFDAEFPGFVAPGVLRDIRLTDRDVILARTDLPSSGLTLSNVQKGSFSINVAIPIGDTGDSFTLLRTWAAVDAKVRGQSFRFITTHLEPENANPLVNMVQVAQAMELVAGPANTDMPVILVGDFNSRADGTGTATYSVLIGAGFTDAWTVTHPDEVGNTWGHDEDLHNTSVNLTQRLDLVLFRGDVSALRADRVGEELPDRTPSGLWPSDHAGVVASLGLHVRPKVDEDSSGRATATSVGALLWDRSSRLARTVHLQPHKEAADGGSVPPWWASITPAIDVDGG